MVSGRRTLDLVLRQRWVPICTGGAAAVVVARQVRYAGVVLALSLFPTPLVVVDPPTPVLRPRVVA